MGGWNMEEKKMKIRFSDSSLPTQNSIHVILCPSYKLQTLQLYPRGMKMSIEQQKQLATFYFPNEKKKTNQQQHQHSNSHNQPSKSELKMETKPKLKRTNTDGIKNTSNT